MKKLGRIIGLALIMNLATSAAHSQQTKQPDRQQLIAAAREIISASRYCALITTDRLGHTQARTVDPFAPNDDFVIRIGTNSRTRKVGEIRRNRRVTLYYFDREAQAYVTIHGKARLINDPQEKMKWFKEEWKAFYADRARDYLLIEVTPESLEIVSVKKGIVGDQLTWRPPSVSFAKVPNFKSSN